MIAIIELKGKQYRVAQDQVIRSLRVSAEPGGKIAPDRVLALIDGDKLELGKPALEGQHVELEVVRHARSPKLRIFTYRKRTRTTRRIGYRDEISYLRVKQIKD